VTRQRAAKGDSGFVAALPLQSIAMFAAIGPLSASLGLVGNAKKAVDVFKEMANVPDEGLLLWNLLDATSAPLELSSRLAARHETLPYIESAVAITRRTIGRCEQLLQRGEEEEDDRPQSGESWAAWFAQKKGGVERRVLVPQLCQNLQMCQQALQLGLTSIQLEFGPGSANPPFRLLPAAVDAARTLIESFEMKRCSRKLLFCAELWELAGSATRKAGADWSAHGLAQVWLRLHAEVLCLELTHLEQDDEEGDDGEGEGGGAAADVGGLAEGVGALRLGDQQPATASETFLTLALDDEIVFERSTLGGIVGSEMCGSAREASSLAYKLSGSSAAAAAAAAAAASGGGGGGEMPAAATPQRRGQATALRFLPTCQDRISAEIVEILIQLCAMKRGT
jgi:hypothetical protein